MGSVQSDRAVPTEIFNLQNLRGQTLLFRCLETGFVTTAPALTRYQKARCIDPARRELVSEFQEATQIVGFFDKWDEVARIKRQIKRSILDQPFGDKDLVDAVTERFMDLGKRHFR